MPWVYHVGTATVKALLSTLTRWRVIGRENVPKEGPLIVVANHLNLADPPLLSASIPRRIAFMVKQELYYRHWGVPFVRACGAFPVDRGRVGRETFRRAEAVLQQGLALGMFPESTRSPHARMQQAYPGAALIALRSRAPILPVGIIGTEKVRGVVKLVLGHPDITVTIGKPFSLPGSENRATKAQLRELTDFIMCHIAELLPESYRGVYADRKGC